jgi:methanogenic corrinoid protein MtbC1
MATIDLMYQALVDLDEESTLELAQRALAEDQVTPLMMLNTCQQALRMVGERYERGKYFLTALVMAGELFKEVLELTPPIREVANTPESSETILLGTVSADIHDIGKNVFKTALQSYGFRVVDLGVDVSKERFLEAVEVEHPRVVCLSGLILVAFESMRETTLLIRSHQEEIGYRPAVVIGGGTVDSDVCAWVGADSWSTDAMEGVRICQELIGQAGKKT